MIRASMGAIRTFEDSQSVNCVLPENTPTSMRKPRASSVKKGDICRKITEVWTVVWFVEEPVVRGILSAQVVLRAG